MTTAVEKTQNNGLATVGQSGIGVTKLLFAREDVKQKFAEMLGKNATSYITSILQIVASNELLAKADANSIYHSAVVAATLNLPLNNNLGFAYIIPFNDKKTGKVLAQFQLGYKGFIQLAQRSGQFKTISATPIYEGQLIEQNPLTGFVFDFTKKTSDKIIGYAAYFALLNGFEKTLYYTVEEINKHAGKYSQTYKRGYGLWKDDFDAMAIKTGLKLLLSKFAPLSVDMQKAVLTDQAVINNDDATDVTYVDNVEEIEVVTLEDLEELFELKKIELSTEELVDANRIIANREVASYKKLQTLLQSK